jgi:hypothetical protein
MNDFDPSDVLKIQKSESKVKKQRRSDIKWSNPYQNQVAHFASCIKSLNVEKLL